VAVDEELMGPLGFSVDQLMELAGLSVACSLAAEFPPTSHKCGPTAVDSVMNSCIVVVQCCDVCTRAMECAAAVAGVEGVVLAAAANKL
jgi:hypothetical protein